MRVVWVAIALLLSSCAAQEGGADTPLRIEEIFVNDDGTFRLHTSTIPNRSELAESLRTLARHSYLDVLVIRAALGDDYYARTTEVRDRAYDAGLRFVMMTASNAVCEHDRIRIIATPKSGPWLIRTTAGDSFEIEGQDFIDPQRWRAQQNVLVCPNWQGNNLFDVGNIERGETLTTVRQEPQRYSNDSRCNLEGEG